MFLAYQELKKERARFILVAIVIVLVGYLTFFLTGLAYGLATSYTRGLEQWGASGIILNENANDTLARSLIHEPEYKDIVGADTALLGVSNATVLGERADDVAVFGVAPGDFYTPVICEGESSRDAQHVVVSDELKKIGIKLGDTLAFKGIKDAAYVVSGFTRNATYQTAPIVYMQLDEWRTFAAEASGMTGMRDATTVNGIVTRGEFDAGKLADTGLTWQPMKDFYFKLPGYKPQVLTFSLMIGFLIGIASFVLAIFMYILTLQKKGIFGVLKAEGVPNGYIGMSVLLQALILSVTGLAVSLAAALATAYILRDKVPFLVNWYLFGGIVAVFIICAVIGSLASVRAVTKIDPVEAIG